MASPMVQLVLHYDGAGFAGWQRQPDERTVQGEIEAVLQRLCGTPIRVTGAGRTDAGVHARGQAAGVVVPEKWKAATLRRALNAMLPDDIWIAEAHEMLPQFHARFSAVSRRYHYLLGTDASASSPFRCRYEWRIEQPLDVELLSLLASTVIGRHAFRAFALQGTAPEDDNHECVVHGCSWKPREGGLTFSIEANRFLHRMVRFLVASMVDTALGRRSAEEFAALLGAANNTSTSAPAPAHGLFLEQVTYPAELYLEGA